MTTPATAPATGAPATTESQPQADQAPMSPQEVKREAFRKETADLVEKDRADREKAERDAKGRFQPQKDRESAGSRPEPKPEAKADQKPEAQERKLKLKIDGQELELSEAEVIKRAQMSSAAQKRMEQAAHQSKQAQQFIELLKTNPRAVLEHPGLGVDLRALAESIVWEQMQAAAKSPEEREREAERRELEEYRQEKARREAESKTAEREQLKEKFRADWSAKFQSALDQAGVPRTDWTVSRMAAYMRQALAKGHRHIQPADVVDMVREDWQSAQREMFGHLDGDALLSMLGDDVTEKVRKAQLARFDGPQTTKPRPVARDEEKPQRYRSVEEMLRGKRSS